MGGVFGACLKSDVVLCGERDKNDGLEPDCGGF